MHSLITTTLQRQLLKVSRSFLFSALAFCGLLSPLTAYQAQAEISNMGEAINMAGRQRMLSQRIAQSYLLIGLQPQSKRASKQLQRSVVEFQANLEDLKAFKPAKPLHNEIKLVADLWQPYKILALSPVSKDNASLLVQQSNPLLAAAHSYVSKLEKLSGSSKAELINISGRQRMLSQRIAKNFLAQHWKVNQQATDALYEDLAEYENVLGYLMASDINTSAIDTQLNKVKGYFAYASKGFDGVMTLSEERLIYVVTGTTDYMLRGMDVTTKMYADLLK
jgi:nitrate/nitrite-specific signal transduction histidine kinase